MMESNEALSKAWEKIISVEAPEIGRAGVIPVFDPTHGSWRLFKNIYVIYEPAENIADPKKVEQLRRNANSLLALYPDTVPALEKLGLRVKNLLKRPITDPADVKSWAESIFNTGPINSFVPAHIADTLALAYDDFTMMLPTKPATYVVAAMPRGSGNSSVVTFDEPYGKRRKLGPRSDQAKTAFLTQEAEKPVRGTKSGSTPAERPDTPVGVQEDHKRRGGRPRADGLESGSPEAKAADAAKRKAARIRRAQMVQPEGGATITELHPQEPMSEPVMTTTVPVSDPTVPERRRLMRRPIA